MSVITRFAPSPTGFLHIGGARTALFNWLFARRHQGQFLLRIEDTDRARSTESSINTIIEGLKWLELFWDKQEIYQTTRSQRHAEIAYHLLEQGHAYRCYATPEELTQMRAEQRASGLPIRYDGRWRDRDSGSAPAHVRPAIRLKIEVNSDTVINDQIQGSIKVSNDQLDDMVLLRADGTPTYMLAVVVDDHDMGITHVIRGDDHLTNTFRQIQISHAMSWPIPHFAHIPLLHGQDGTKLSKRHGALSVEAYRDMGYLPQALCNYLLRLGWSHGDEEILSMEQATKLFSLEKIGRSPARFDQAKLDHLNRYYLRHADEKQLLPLIVSRLETSLGRPLSKTEHDLIRRALPVHKSRAKSVEDLAEGVTFYVSSQPLPRTDKAKKLLDATRHEIIQPLITLLQNLEPWNALFIESVSRSLAEQRGEKLGQIAQPLRAALTGSTISPPIFDIAELLGRKETLARLHESIL